MKRALQNGSTKAGFFPFPRNPYFSSSRKPTEHDLKNLQEKPLSSFQPRHAPPCSTRSAHPAPHTFSNASSARFHAPSVLCTRPSVANGCLYKSLYTILYVNRTAWPPPGVVAGELIGCSRQRANSMSTSLSRAGSTAKLRTGMFTQREERVDGTTEGRTINSNLKKP